MLRHEIETILRLEREGEKRLAGAREDAARIVEGSHLQAAELIRQTEEEIARENERRMAAGDEETARLVAELRRELHERENFLHTCAERHRQKAVERVFDLIRR